VAVDGVQVLEEERDAALERTAGRAYVGEGGVGKARLAPARGLEREEGPGGEQVHRAGHCVAALSHEVEDDGLSVAIGQPRAEREDPLAGQADEYLRRVERLQAEAAAAAGEVAK